MRFHAQQRDIHLNRRIAQQAQELQLRLELFGHDIEHKNPQRTNILMRRAVAVHDEDMFIEKRLIGRQLRRNTNRQKNCSFLSPAIKWGNDRRSFTAVTRSIFIARICYTG